jgi:hypothetical protein
MKVIPKANSYSEIPFSSMLHDMVRFLKAPLQAGDSLSTDGYTIINLGDVSGDKALVVKGEDPRPTVAIDSLLAPEYALTDISIPFAFNSNATNDFDVATRSPEICKISQSRIVLSGAGKCELVVKPGPDPKFKNSKTFNFTFEIRDNRTEATAKNLYYQDTSACHTIGVNAVLQVNRDGAWVDYLPAQGWEKVATCRSTHPQQPWLITELPSNIQYRWRLFAPGWTTDFFSPVGVAPLTAADLEAKKKADQEAERLAAEQKAKAEAEAKLKAEQLAAKKKITITCTKGKLTKKVTATSPKCPAGYKKK